MTTTTLYVQIISPQRNDRWRTVLETTDRALADWVSEGLASKKSTRGGIRICRIVSRTKLEQMGVAAVAQAEHDTKRGWNDDPKIRGRTLLNFGYRIVRHEIDALIESYHEDKREREREGTVDFLIRDMPGRLHARLKKAAEIQEGTTMREIIINSLRRAV